MGDPAEQEAAVCRHGHTEPSEAHTRHSGAHMPCSFLSVWCQMPSLLSLITCELACNPHGVGFCQAGVCEGGRAKRKDVFAWVPVGKRGCTSAVSEVRVPVHR